MCSKWTLLLPLSEFIGSLFPPPGEMGLPWDGILESCRVLLHPTVGCSWCPYTHLIGPRQKPLAAPRPGSTQPNMGSLLHASGPGGVLAVADAASEAALCIPRAEHRYTRVLPAAGRWDSDPTLQQGPPPASPVAWRWGGLMHPRVRAGRPDYLGVRLARPCENSVWSMSSGVGNKPCTRSGDRGLDEGCAHGGSVTRLGRVACSTIQTPPLGGDR